MWYKFAPSGGAASSAASPAASPAPSPAASFAGCLPRRPGAEREPLPGALALGPGVPGARGALPEEGFNLGPDGRRFAGRPGLFSPGLVPWALRRLEALVVQVAPLPPPRRTLAELVAAHRLLQLYRGGSMKPKDQK